MYEACLFRVQCVFVKGYKNYLKIVLNFVWIHIQAMHFLNMQ